MAPATRPSNEPVADLARRILNVVRANQEAHLPAGLSDFGQIIAAHRVLNTLEAEKLEVLASAVEGLESRVADRVRAGMVLLEHLSDAAFEHKGAASACADDLATEERLAV